MIAQAHAQERTDTDRSQRKIERTHLQANPDLTSRTWTAERLEQLKQHFAAGLTCAQIAAEIGVSRNAVVGKIHRLGFARVRVKSARPKPEPMLRRPRFAAPPGQRQLLKLLRDEYPEDVVEIAIPSASRCSLMELSASTCRWPINEPGAEDFAFCGNTCAGGLPYCGGHARMAYRAAGVRRA
jgi:GcrA cell cycle regulator